MRPGRVPIMLVRFSSSGEDKGTGFYYEHSQSQASGWPFLWSSLLNLPPKNALQLQALCHHQVCIMVKCNLGLKHLVRLVGAGEVATAKKASGERRQAHSLLAGIL
jgi:hypothetical protein